MVAHSSGKCRCGSVSIAIDTKPFLTYNCHCSHCRAFASRHRSEPAAYHGGGAVFKWNVALEGEENIEYEQSTSLGGLLAMSRGRCSKCHECIWESGERAMLPVAMVMTELLPNLNPDTDIFYDSGLKGGPTTSTVIRSDLGSLFYEIIVILFMAVPTIPWTVLKRLTRRNDGSARSKVE
ncbi:expressed unknown protein [Seminavis robusta]|uniref:CENP-V/GFA domain-containing protein n=1 Tax=Seminavis robusta TaxID=568900 RepID=A0A9N8EMX0_9STRA|nr:expressed unknown protein [Seminavis robusta]CAB9522313.1 expressed unknown protein [Seminavis robusta]|eukprot:Sro1195_g251430.1 n/a (180) ;mRNA; r:29329-29868